MIYRINSLRVLPEYLLEVSFDDGKTVIYDVKEYMEHIPSYAYLKRIEGLFNQAKVDTSRTCVVWNENIDLPSDIIYEYGKSADNAANVAEESAKYGAAT